MKDRYNRQELCSFIGINGQKSIQQSHVLLIGAGALGSASAEMLVRAGVGTLSIIDRDYVEWSNLHRQSLYTEQDCEEVIPKAIAAKRLSAINRDVTIHAHVLDANAANLHGYVTNVDVIIDATDNFDIRFILNDLSQKYEIPFIFGSCVASYGMSFTILPKKSPCLHCLLKQIPLTGATCDSVGVISPIVQLIASYQVTECMKLLVGDEESLRTSFLSIDLWQNKHFTLNVEKAKQEECLSCGKDATFPFLQYESQTKTSVLCGRNTVQIRPSKLAKTDLDQLEKTLQKRGVVKRNPFLLSSEQEAYRCIFFNDGRVFIHGTNDITKAKNIYYSLLG